MGMVALVHVDGPTGGALGECRWSGVFMLPHAQKSI